MDRKERKPTCVTCEKGEVLIYSQIRINYGIVEPFYFYQPSSACQDHVIIPNVLCKLATKTLRNNGKGNKKNKNNDKNSKLIKKIVKY